MKRKCKDSGFEKRFLMDHDRQQENYGLTFPKGDTECMVREVQEEPSENRAMEA